jgi:glyoxylase-like metal-dependent hydrolase (beta-lactamase superfamily II)
MGWAVHIIVDMSEAKLSAVRRAATARVHRFDTAGGRKVYRLRLEVFPGFSGNAYLIEGGSRPILVDTGSSSPQSIADLDSAFAELKSEHGFAVTPADLGAIVITHGHIDHFGGLAGLEGKTKAPVGIHLLDRRVISSWAERLVVATRQVGHFFHQAGVEPGKREKYLDTYRAAKSFFKSHPPVDFTFDEGPLLGGELEAIHVPGHCPGQVNLKVDDLLLTADHVLDKITPHISPEMITSETGVGHYLASLHKIEKVEGVRLGLGGHMFEIPDIARRSVEIRQHLETRLGKVLELCAAGPRTIVDISKAIYGKVRSYHVLLAILEAGALVEYLYQHGDLVVANLEELEREANPPILYRRL